MTDKKTFPQRQKPLKAEEKCADAGIRNGDTEQDLRRVVATALSTKISEHRTFCHFSLSEKATVSLEKLPLFDWIGRKDP